MQNVIFWILMLFCRSQLKYEAAHLHLFSCFQIPVLSDTPFCTAVSANNRSHWFLSAQSSFWSKSLPCSALFALPIRWLQYSCRTEEAALRLHTLCISSEDTSSDLQFLRQIQNFYLTIRFFYFFHHKIPIYRLLWKKTSMLKSHLLNIKC